MALDPLKILDDLVELATPPAIGDAFVIVDISEGLDINKTKHILAETLFSGVLLDWEELTVADWTSAAGAAYQTVPSSTITLALATPGVVISFVTCNLSSNHTGDFAAVRTYIDGNAGDGIQTISGTEYYIAVTVMHIKACAAGNIDCDIRIYGEGAYKAKIQNAQIIALAIAGS